MRTHWPHRPSRGFSLIELLVTIAIIGILAAVAGPSFVKYKQRSIRGEGTECLMRVQTLEEAYFQRNSTYTNSIATLNVPASCGPAKLYTLSVGTVSGCGLTRCYRATATPVAGSSQVADGTLRLQYDFQAATPDLRMTRTRTVNSVVKPWY